MLFLSPSFKTVMAQLIKVWATGNDSLRTTIILGPEVLNRPLQESIKTIKNHRDHGKKNDVTSALSDAVPVMALVLLFPIP